MSESHSNHAGPAANRFLRIQRLIDECIARRLAGEPVSDDDVLASNAELLPELARELRRASLIAQARQTRRAVDTLPAGSGSSRTSPDPPTGVRDDDHFPGYVIEALLHRGGQGRVYRATQVSTGQPVAIKVPRPGVDATAGELARLEREARILASFRHPNVIRIFDSGVTSGGKFYFVMELIDGRPLDQYVERSPELSARRSPAALRRIVALLCKVCDAVSAAHARGIIHRDLKPGNILVNAHGDPIVLDFGLAKYLDPGDSADHTLAEPPLGSPPWSSPEQAAGSAEGLDTRSDVYSLGMVAYWLMAGAPPYEVRGDLQKVLDNVRHAAPRPPRSLNPAIDNELAAILLFALRKERERRYQSVAALTDDLRAWLDCRPVRARGDSPGYLLSKLAQRYWLPLSFSAALLAVLVVAGVVTFQAWRAAAANQRGYELVIGTMYESLLANDAIRGAGPAMTLPEWIDLLESKITANPEYVPSQVELGFRLLLAELGEQSGNRAAAARNLKRASDLHSAIDAGWPAFAWLATAQAEQLFADGDAQQALATLQSALEQLKAAGGPDRSRAMLLSKLGDFQYQSHEFEAARATLEEAVRLQRAGRGIAAAYYPINLLGIVRLDQYRQAPPAQRDPNDAQAAEELIREALANARALEPTGHPILRPMLLNLGVLTAESDRAEESVKLLREARQIGIARNLGDSLQATIGVALGMAELARGSPEAATEPLREAATLRAAALGQDAWQTANARSLLGEALWLTGDVLEAGELLTSSLQVLRAHRSAPPRVVEEATVRVTRHMGSAAPGPKPATKAP